jgi:hypothetical protein
MLYIQPPEIVDPTTTIIAVQYNTVQEAIDAAELLPAADLPPGVTVILPSGTIEEDLLIRKNVSLKGLGIDVTVVRSITIRPTSDTVSPSSLALSDMTIGIVGTIPNLLVTNETGPASGVFNLDMFAVITAPSVSAGLFIYNCQITDIAQIVNVNAVVFDKCVSFGELNVTNSYTIYGKASSFGIVNLTTDSALPNAPTSFSLDPNSYFVSRFSTASQVNLTSGGTYRSMYEGVGSLAFDLVANADTDIVLYSGSILGKTLNGSGHNLTFYDAIPYTQTVPSDWTTNPQTLGAALDELAARLTLAGF